MKCNICTSENIILLGGIGKKQSSVTSDSKLSNHQARIFLCRDCHHHQKIFEPDMNNIIDEIYAQYDAHYLSGGKEQIVFLKNSTPKPRTYYVLQQCVPLLPPKGKLLDVGSGNGAVLKSASEILSNWSLHAFDLNDNNQAEILNIPRVECFTSGSIEKLPRKYFDLITLWHVLEHIAEPNEFLRSLKEFLVDDGYLLIQVPDLNRNPFDLGVIDHCSHFEVVNLISLFEQAGFELVINGTDWLENCITLLLKLKSTSMPNVSFKSMPIDKSIYFQWLNNVCKEFDELTSRSDFAIFGTGMASIFLLGQLSKKPVSIIEEDKDRIGRKIYNIPIISPADIGEGLKIVMPFPYHRGKNIIDKIKKEYNSCQTCDFILCKAYNEN